MRIARLWIFWWIILHFVCCSCWSSIRMEQGLSLRFRLLRSNWSHPSTVYSLVDIFKISVVVQRRFGLENLPCRCIHIFLLVVSLVAILYHCANICEQQQSECCSGDEYLISNNLFSGCSIVPSVLHGLFCIRNSTTFAWQHQRRQVALDGEKEYHSFDYKVCGISGKHRCKSE